MLPPKISRRTLVKAGFAGGMMSALGSLGRQARAQQPPSDRPVVVMLWFDGGFSQIFSTANSYLESPKWFGVTSSNIVEVGGGIFVDKDTFGALPATILARMGVIGARYGWSDHNFGGTKPWLGLDPTTSNPVMLAQAIGGHCPLRYVHIGSALRVSHLERDGIFCTPILDLKQARALVQGATSPDLPDKRAEIAGLLGMHKMSRRRLAASPERLREFGSSLRGLVSVLAAPPLELDWLELAAAYGLDPEVSALADMATKLAAAELMVRYGSDVVTVTVDSARIDGGGWDSHGDVTHEKVRSEMTRLVMPALPTFLSRMLNLPGHNVVVAVTSHFGRTGGSNEGHGSTLSAPVWGKRIKNATTGFEPLLPTLPVGRDSVREHMAFLLEAAGVAGRPFGAHSHGALLA